MAKIVIAGVADCPRFAQVELLADQLVCNLPEFQLHKITKSPDEWQTWLSEVCQARGWSHTKSPVVWRELVDRGGKGLLIGGANEFKEYVSSYYGVESPMVTDLACKVAAENLSTTEQLTAEEKARKAAVKPLKICITAADSRTGYELVSRLASGDVFGPDVVLSLRLCDENVESLRGVAMEATDLASGLVHDTIVTADPNESFADCDVIVLLDRVDRNDNETRADWLHRVHQVFSGYAVAMEKITRTGTKVIIAGGGSAANFAGTVFCRVAPNLDPKNVVVLSGAAESLARGAVSSRLGVNSASIVDLVIWGDASGSDTKRFIVDASQARIFECDNHAIWGPGHSMPVTEAVHDDRWVELELPKVVTSRRSAGQVLAMVTADAVKSLLAEWWNGRYSQYIHSLAVASRGWFGIPDGLFFSVPVRFTAPKTYKVVEDFQLNENVLRKMRKVIQVLETDVEVVYPNPNKQIRVRTPKVKFIELPTPEHSTLQDGSIVAADEEHNEITGQEAAVEVDEPAVLEKISENDEDDEDVDGDGDEEEEEEDVEQE